jgi:hypothetical protein
MTTLLEQWVGRRSRKSWRQPNFWDLDAAPLAQLSTSDRETIEKDFLGYAENAYKANGVIFSVALTRQLILSEGRFLWRKMRNGRPNDMMSNAELGILERPWPCATTGTLITRMDMDATIAGNSYWTTVADGRRFGAASRGGANRRMFRMRPDWVWILMGIKSDPLSLDINGLEREVLAFIYDPPDANGARGNNVTTLLPREVSHYAPVPDPSANYRGMSWLTPIIREIMADRAATEHKLNFFKYGATPKVAVSLPKDLPFEEYQKFVTLFKQQHEGFDNAYRTLVLGGGADVTVVGADMRQLDFKVTQGAGETRIAAAARVPPVIAGLSEGLQGSSLNAGNFQASRRMLGDGCLRPLWREMAGSLENLLIVPSKSHNLWYDDRDIVFLREDAKDKADIQMTQAQAIRNLTDAGYEALSIIEALLNDDWTLLKHSGLFSVQLQPAGSQGGTDANANNNANDPSAIAPPADGGSNNGVAAGAGTGGGTPGN